MTPEVKQARARRLQERIECLQACKKKFPARAENIQLVIDGINKEIKELLE